MTKRYPLCAHSHTRIAGHSSVHFVFDNASDKLWRNIRDTVSIQGLCPRRNVSRNWSCNSLYLGSDKKTQYYFMSVVWPVEIPALFSSPWSIPLLNSSDVGRFKVRTLGSSLEKRPMDWANLPIAIAISSDNKTTPYY